jgi:hypothetical protein
VVAKGGGFHGLFFTAWAAPWTVPYLGLLLFFGFRHGFPVM